jgi:MoxR-like ATPase
MMTMVDESPEQSAFELLQRQAQPLKDELAKRIVGQADVVEQLLLALLAGGHCLLTGAPGLAKTLLVKSVAELFELKFQRIQFTPDLMPSDITGTEILQEDESGRRKLTFVRGPLFSQVLLADEINRTPPKTQAALLEAMQEHQVTAAGVRHVLPQPFFVLATQNPIEMEGTYSLPEAQLDRFMFNVVVTYPPERDEVQIVLQTTAGMTRPLQPLLSGDELLRLQQLVRSIPVAHELVQYAVRLAAASRPHQPGVPGFVNEFVSWGAGLRASQNLILGAKARAAWQGRVHVTVDDIRRLAHPTLRHRILLNYRADAAQLSVDQVIDRLLDTIPEPGR